MSIQILYIIFVYIVFSKLITLFFFIVIISSSHPYHLLEGEKCHYNTFFCGQNVSLYIYLPLKNEHVQVQFKVSGTTKDLFGDGFAIWYVKDRMQQGGVFGSKDEFSGQYHVLFCVA